MLEDFHTVGVQLSKKVPSRVSGEGEAPVFGAVRSPREESVPLLTWSIDLPSL